jgi:hypothetical protein
MLRRFLIVLPLVLLALVAIDRASLFFAPCVLEKSSDAYQNDSGGKQRCAENEGVIIAGAELLKTIPAEWVAAFSGIAVAFFTFTLWKSTERLWRSSEKALEASTEHTATLFNIERAHLVGGGQVIVPGKTFQVEFSNYGKTTAFIYAFDIEFAMLAEVEPGPREVFPMRYFEDAIPPHSGGGGPQRKVPFDINPPNAEVAYGAFWHEDWQKHVHIFRFILKIVPGVAAVSIPGIHPSYTYRD